jgi:hypothetical protein
VPPKALMHSASDRGVDMAEKSCTHGVYGVKLVCVCGDHAT